MYNRTMSIQVAENLHNVGDILYINEERWVVTHINHEYYSSTIHCKPLADCMAETNYIDVNNFKMTIAEYIKIICDEYEANCTN